MTPAATETLKLPPSFTTLSTIAIQAGQSQLTISVLRVRRQSGHMTLKLLPTDLIIHLQLVQVHPGLSEIGSDLDENQTLIQDLQQLLQKLQVLPPKCSSDVFDGAAFRHI